MSNLIKTELATDLVMDFGMQGNIPCCWLLVVVVGVCWKLPGPLNFFLWSM